LPKTKSQHSAATCLALTAALFVTTIATAYSQVSFPVKSSANRRYLVDRQNRPVPILGRTSWFVISLPAADYSAYIENCVSLGYNSIEMHVLDHDPRGNHPPFNGNGDLPFLKRLDGAPWDGKLIYTDKFNEAPDLTTPNEKYWIFVDSFLALCESRGVLVFFFPAYLGYPASNQGWMQELVANGADGSRAYGEWIARRYKDQKNIVWMLLGDMGKFNPEEKLAEAGLIKGLKSVPGQQSVHYTAESDSQQNAADQEDFGHEMTLNGVYTWGGSVTVPDLGRQGYAHEPTMPAFLLEEPYDEEGTDGNGVNPHAIQPVRRFQWWGWLTTIAGYISGNGYVWPFVDPWREHLDTQGARDMARLNSFIRSLRWWQLVPSGMGGSKELVAAGGGVPAGEDYVAAAATADGKLLVAYLPPAHIGTVTIDMTAMKPRVLGRWYDPTSGKYTDISGSPFSNKGTHPFTPPTTNSRGEGDWVLVLEAR
jgi:hypothetical protein